MRAIIGLLERIANALETLAGCELRKREMFKASGPKGDVPTKQEIAKLPKIEAHGKRIAHVKPEVHLISLEGVRMPKTATVGHCWYVRTLGVPMREMTAARKALGIANLGTGNNPRHMTSLIPAVVDEINRRRLGL